MAHKRRNKNYICGPWYKKQTSSHIYDQEAIDRLIRSSNIVEFIGKLTPLKKCKNGDYVGMCLFCQQKHGPSKKNNHKHFRIHRTKKNYKCFRCGIGGRNLISFVTRYYNVPFEKCFRIVYNSLQKDKKFAYNRPTMNPNYKYCSYFLGNAVSNGSSIRDEDLPF